MLAHVIHGCIFEDASNHQSRILLKGRITTLKNVVWKNFFPHIDRKKTMAKTVRRAKAKAKKLHGTSQCHYAFYAGTAIRQGLLLSWHHQPNHCSFYRPLHHHYHQHHHHFQSTIFTLQVMPTDAGCYVLPSSSSPSP